MKHCPACSFKFPDFHLVCDFDGTELVPDQPCLSLIKLPPRRSSFRRSMTSPKALTALAILGLFLGAAFIAYQQTTSRSTRTLLAANISTPPLETPAPMTGRKLTTSAPSAARSRKPQSPSLRTRHSSSVRSAFAGNHREKPSEDRARPAEVAHRSGTAQSEKQPKLVSMLKTTWRVLKRPFSF